MTYTQYCHGKGFVNGITPPRTFALGGKNATSSTEYQSCDGESQ